MKVSLNTVKSLIDFELPPVEELVERINMQLGGVEEVIDLRPKYKDVLIVKVVECEKHPNADKLSVCMIDDGGAAKDVERDERGLVRVVCGAPNACAGIFAAWLPPGSTVPASFGDANPFILDARELRGIKSNGMLAAADELDLGSDHEGIIEITEGDIKSHESRVMSQELICGASFAEVFGLNDVIIDIENKMFTHRPDCFGQLGVAREIAGILGQKFTSPAWYGAASSAPSLPGEELPLTVFNNVPKKCPRFMAVALHGVSVKPSPLWLQIELVRLGSKPINNIVDATNYLMLLTAQPTHAYDYDKLHGHTLGVRMAAAGEKATLLNGKTYELTEEDIVIVDSENVVGVGGVMGGGTSEVSPETKNIVLECANFDMYAVRKTSMRHGLFTDALTRFSKGQSALQNPFVLQELDLLVKQLAGGVQASKVFDEMHADVLTRTESLDGAVPLSIDPQFIRERLGLDIRKYDMVQMLGNVEFPSCQDCGWDPDDTKDNNEAWHISIPFWRTDIVDPEDIVEEVGRLHGFDKLSRELPKRTITPAPKNVRVEMKRKITKILSEAGANEVKTYSFVHANVLKNASQGTENAFGLSNALSPDLQYYRLSVLPSLLDRVHANIKTGHDEFALFELGKGHDKTRVNKEENLPEEQDYVELVYAAKKAKKQAAFYQVRRFADRIASSLHIEFTYTPVDEQENPVLAPYDLRRTAEITAYANGKKVGIVGYVGEFKRSVISAFKLPDYSAGLSFSLDGLQVAHLNANTPYRPLSRFPSVSQDISLKVDASVAYADVYAAAEKALRASMPAEMVADLTPLGIYEPNDTTTHTITLRLKIVNYERTLTDDEVKRYVQAMANAAAVSVAAQLV